MATGQALTAREHSANLGDRRYQHPTINTEPLLVVEVFTVFTSAEKQLLKFLIGTAMLFSPLSANIYFPGIVILAKAFNRSTQLINLTITAYVVMQGIAPTLLGGLADSFGRRPVLLASFAIYLFANLGLAVQNSYAALLVLRIIQSFGCSAHGAISYGIVADVSTPDERGSMLGPAMVATNLGTTLAPVLGGLLVHGAGWRWTFWFLLIVGASFLTILILFLPETARAVVGNGSRSPVKLYRPLISVIGLIRIPKATGALPDHLNADSAMPKLHFQNPFQSLRIIVLPDAAFILSLTGTFYMVYYCVQASMTSTFQQVYEFNELFTGLSYLGMGFGVLIGGYLNAKLMDLNYRVKAKQIGHEIDRLRGDDLRTFPIEQTRLRFMPYWTTVCMIFLISYGWIVSYHRHVSVAIILQFGLGFIATVIVQTVNTLLVDIFIEQPSTAAAAGNLVRCGLAASGVAAMQPLIDRIGIGWFFTALGLLSGIYALICYHCIVVHGMKWRQKRCTPSE